MKTLLAIALALSFAAPVCAAPCTGGSCGTQGAIAPASKQKLMQRGPARRALVKVLRLGAPS